MLLPIQTFKMADIHKTRNGGGVTTTGNGKKGKMGIKWSMGDKVTDGARV